MRTKSFALKTAAFIAAAALTSGAAAPVSGTFAPAPATAYADDYSEVKQDGLTILKYSDHAEISNCDMSATSVEIPASVDGVPVTVIQMYAFQPTEITEITIPDSVKEIGNYAFSGNKELKSVTISDSIEKIGLRAFEQCPKLETVELPDKVFDMGAKVFSETPWLEAHRDSNSLVIVNNMLIDAEGAEGDIVIPSNVKYISPSAFQRNPQLTSVVVPSGVTKLNDNVFALCGALKSVELKGVESIDCMAFYDTPQLTELKLSGKLKSIDSMAFMDTTCASTITFYGSKETWDKVQKPEDDAYLKNATYIFIDEPIDDPDDPKPSLLGDANLDGKVTIADGTAILQSIANQDKYALNDEAKLNADCCNPGDGVTAADALTIKKLDAGVIQTLPELTE
ncbi:MAG: leucine-rich repeat protein [Ruminococcus sp.]|nr:leucine-rich repeat protein [Ruminococcus sp.]